MKFVVNLRGRFHETKTEISVGENSKLSDLANAICCSKLNKFEEELCDDTHLYGFTESTYSFFSNNLKRNKYIKHSSQFELNDEEKSCQDTNVDFVFNCIGKKLMFVYDFGSVIEIIVKRIS